MKIVKKAHDPRNVLGTDLTGLEEDPADCRQYVSQMTRLCRENGGCGLAAPQAGLLRNFFLVMPGGPNAILPSKVAELCINPQWEAAPDARQATYKEGCLSLEKGKQYEVSRWTKIHARWQNVCGHLVTRTLTGGAAQVFQHEHDHLRGLTLVETGVPV